MCIDINETEEALWNDGWLDHTKIILSPNHKQRDSENISLIVLHNISLPPFEYTSNYVENLFTNSIDESKHSFFENIKDLKVSSHFFINRLGELVQFVSCDQSAFHAGVSCFNGKTDCNQFSIGIELEGCDFEAFTLKQYEKLNSLVNSLIKKYPIQAITGHDYIARDRKTDPGHFFDWNKLDNTGIEVYRV